MLKGFREFLSRGNVVDLAVAIVVGTAFTAVINSIVDGLINPLVAAVFGERDLTQVATFTINNAQFSLGLILDALFNFVIIAAAVYFLVIMPINKLRALKAREAEQEAAVAEPSEEVVLLREIRNSLQSRT
ncbi:large conductance mechanosensitive channel protein MscL [Actinobacteria bacterium YIM 96077]|uniref:Large-conductance mechanosensitive channel n=1 Tax=Phytoactinopolyspora halophila TaxID=1981511 RepID=A0A329QXX1_9ACTN|nr:large conductance mechanosensitive channel protein MscL [Phytoactinopolyspora halophila]AYY15739.1 large conductance mechanosensitive channel protein MscL [Actinobacteria bacterium YIM 96077]RAW15478.1 large conductance mechanosensitive channel protein MscL [Phytoactinopolyspora halophila]